jgi:hypothetical protein
VGLGVAILFLGPPGGEGEQLWGLDRKGLEGCEEQGLTVNIASERERRGNKKGKGERGGGVEGEWCAPGEERGQEIDMSVDKNGGEMRGLVQCRSLECDGV